MRTWRLQWSLVLPAMLSLAGAIANADSIGDGAMTYETVDPARIKLGESATLRVTTLDGYLNGISLPTVTGLEFEIIGHRQGVEFVNNISIQASYILIRVTPQITGVFSIPGLTPKSPTVGLEVVSADAPPPPPFRLPKQMPPPAPVSTASVPKGIPLEANGAAFVHMAVPTRAVYVGETVPVDIELGVRPGIVTALEGNPELKGGDFTLTNILKQRPLRREQVIDGSPFLVFTWHSAIATTKPGDFSLSVETPLRVRIDTRSAAEVAFSAMLGWPFNQGPSNGSPSREVTVASPAGALKVLALPPEGRPTDFSGAVGDFQVSSDVSSSRVVAGDPLTLRLHVSGVGNFDRVDAPMFDHLDHWKTYPAKASFTPSDPAGDKGEKVFEQPLIAAVPGEQSIPSLSFSYFNPSTRQYERAESQPITVLVSGSLAETAGLASARGQIPVATGRNSLAAGLRADHPASRSSVSDLRPLYFQAPFLAIPTALALILAGSWFALRTPPTRAASTAADRALAQLDAAARSGDASSFFDLARAALLHTFATRWQISPDKITSTELKTRLGAVGEEINRLLALAEEAKYSDYDPSGTDFQRWTRVVRGQLTGEGA
jgi:hypothetical protein